MACIALSRFLRNAVGPRHRIPGGPGHRDRPDHGTGVPAGAAVGVRVAVAVGVRVAVRVGVRVGVRVRVAVGVRVAVRVGVGVLVGAATPLIALSAFTMPQPVSASNPAALISVAVDLRRLTMTFLSVMPAEIRSATTPATCGAEKDVPEPVA